MNAIFRYPGAKWSLANWIISYFPEDYEKMVYLEPFVGSGAVFFNKLPGAVETINDLDSDIVNLFYVLREHPEELKRLLELTPYSREEYDKAFEPCEDPIEKARRYMIKTTQAIGAKLGTKCGWRNHKQMKIGGTACQSGTLPRYARLSSNYGNGGVTIADKNKNTLTLLDAELKKSLERCILGEDCADCMFYSPTEECLNSLHRKSLDLINRQQAEIERLKPFEEKISEFNSHIRVEDMLVFASSLEEWLEFCDNLKAEAIKEFAERLKAMYKVLCVDEGDWYSELDNLVKVMAGDIK